MKKQKINTNGFTVIEVVIVVVILIVLGLVGYKVFSAKKNKTSQADNQAKTTTATEKTASSDARKDGVVMKSIGFNVDYYNETTASAGDMKFTKIPLPFNQIWGDFGQQDPRSPNDATKRNPQPTYILPLGTKVQSLIDGTVTKVEKLYSGDTTIWVSPVKDSQLNFETEHVMKATVKVGDVVKSGQVIAEVSDFDTSHHPGFGIVEIGVLGQSGNRPSHSCPYQYLDSSVKDEMLKKITSVHDAWEKYIGKDVYVGTSALPGCTTLDPVAE